MTKLIPTQKNLPVGSILMRHSQVLFVRLLHTYLLRSNTFYLVLTLTQKLHLATGSRLCVTFMTMPNNYYCDLSWLMMYDVFSNWPCVVLSPWSVVPVTSTNFWVAYRMCVTSKTRNISASQRVIQNYNCLSVRYYIAIVPLRSNQIR